MSFQSIVSELDRWVDISDELRVMTDIMVDYVDFYDVVSEINDILQEAPSDVGGEIEFPYTKEDVEELNYRFLLLSRFTDGIHYEVDENIDVPFTQELKSTLESVYSINPKDYRTKENFWFFKRGDSLEDIMTDLAASEELKESYETMIEQLDTDSMSEDLEEIFAVADYWENQYEIASDIREVHSRYVENYAEGWQDLTDDEKLAILTEYAKEYGNALELRDNYKSGIAVSVEWNINDPRYDPTSTSYAYTRPGLLDGKIFVNADIFSGSTHDLNYMLQLVSHEARHLYQGQARHDSDSFEIPTIISEEWHFVDDPNDQVEYYELPWEIDARGYAAVAVSYIEVLDDEK